MAVTAAPRASRAPRARLPRLPRVRARPVAQHARGLPLRPAAVRRLLERDAASDALGRRARRPRRVPGRARRAAATGAPPVAPGDAAAQGRLPALVLPPPAPRGAARPRPDRRPARAAQEPAAAARCSRATRSRAARPAHAATEPAGAARPRAARADVRVRPARVGGDRPRGRATSTSTPASCAPAARAPRSGSCRSAAARSRAVRAYLRARAARARRASATSRACSSTAAAAA